MKQWWIFIVAIMALAIIVGIGITYAPKPPVSESIRKQLKSTLLLPKGGGVQVDRESVNYDPTHGLLSFNANAYGDNVVFSEQPSPEAFTSKPDRFNTFLTTIGQYKQFDIDVGTVYLAKPSDLKGKQMAVINTKGTLLIAKPSGEYSEDQWRKLFRVLSVVK